MPRIVGYAATYGRLTCPYPARDGGRPYRRRWLPGAFRRIAAAGCRPSGAPILCLVNHDFERCLGSTLRNLRLGEDPTGLWFELTLDRDPLSLRVAEQLRRGELWGCSIWPAQSRDYWAEERGERILEHAEVLDLKEITLTDKPANPCTGARLID